MSTNSIVSLTTIAAIAFILSYGSADETMQTERFFPAAAFRDCTAREIAAEERRHNRHHQRTTTVEPISTDFPPLPTLAPLKPLGRMHQSLSNESRSNDTGPDRRWDAYHQSERIQIDKKLFGGLFHGGGRYHLSCCKYFVEKVDRYPASSSE